MKGFIKALSLLLALVLFSGCTSIFPEEEGELAPPVIKPKEISYKTQIVKRGDIQDVQKINGEIVPIEIEYQYVTLKGSRLANLYVRLGQSVEAGDLLMEFVTDDLESQIYLKEKAINMAEFDYETALKLADIDAVLESDQLSELEDQLDKVDINLDKLQLEQIEAIANQIAAMELSYDNLVMNYDYSVLQKEYALFIEDNFGVNNYYKVDRMELLEVDLANTLEKQRLEIAYALDEISDLKVKIDELYTSTAEDKVEQQEALQKQIDTQTLIIEKNLLNRLNTLTAKKNNLDIDRYMLNQLYADLEQSKVEAVISGDIVYIRDMEEGDIIYDFDKLIGIADESDYLVLYEGSEAKTLSLNMDVFIDYNNETYLGRVVQTPESAPEGQEESYLNIAKIEFYQLPEAIKRGEKVTVRIILAEKTDTLIIPKSAVYKTFDDVLVYVLEDGVKKERYVELGVESATEVEVLDGLIEGELVVLN